MPSHESVRTFLAIEMGEGTRQRLEILAQDLAPELKGFRWTKPDQLHLTLAFLGDVDSNRISDLIAGLSKVTRTTASFDVQWRSLGAFPKPERASILWVGVDHGRGDLIALHHDVAEMLTALGFSKDPKFTPHVTLARAKRYGGRPADLRPLISRFREVEFGLERTSEVVVMRSDCRPTGSIYSPLATLPLG
jgi:2'-5' RNA ligase